MRTKYLLGRLTFLLVLLLACSQVATAKDGVIESVGQKMKYSFSGGTYISTGKVNSSSSGGLVSTSQPVYFDIKESESITASVAPGTQLPKGANYTVSIQFFFYDKKGINEVAPRFRDTKKNGTLSVTQKIPSNAEMVQVHASYRIGMVKITALGTYNVEKPKSPARPSAKETPISTKCHEVDSKIRFNDLYGEVNYRCNFEEDDSYEFANLDVVLYENDRIKTYEESGAILGLEDMSTYVMKPESILIICDTYDSRPSVVQKLDLIVGTMLVNIKKMAAGKSLEVEMSQCICGGEGTIFALEETGKESRVYLLVGKASVKNKKTGNKTVLKPGQVVTVKDKTSNVATFNVEQVAKKYGCPNSEIKNHYTNKKAPKYSMSDICGKQISSNSDKSATKQKNTPVKRTNQLPSNKQANAIGNSGNNRSGSTSNGKQTNASSKSSSSTPNGKYARYGVKCGIMKSVDEGDKIRMYITTWWDDYGRLERSEITRCEEKKGNKWVDSSFNQLISIIIDDKDYMYTKSIGWNQMRNNKTIFMGSGAKTVNGCTLTKSGTATVAGKQCDVFKGKKNGTTIEYYIWEGVVMKHVEKDSDFTSSTTVQSIELPTSIDSSKFAVPKQR